MKTAIITGASGNLGQAVAKKFLNENYYVVGTIIPNDPVVIDIKNKNFETVIVDLMNEDGSQKFIESVVAGQSTIDTAPNRQAMPDADFSKWVKPEAIADVIYFYCTQEASVIRESVIKVYNNA